MPKKKRVKIRKLVCNTPSHKYQDERIKDLIASNESQGSYINVLQEKKTELKAALGRANLLCEVQTRQYNIINEVLGMFKPVSEADLKKFLGEGITNATSSRPVCTTAPTGLNRIELSKRP